MRSPRLVLLALCALLASAAVPRETTATPVGTRGSELERAGTSASIPASLKMFLIPAQYSTDPAPVVRSSEGPGMTAILFLAEKLQLDPRTLAVTDVVRTESTNIDHVYVTQTCMSVQIVNMMAAVNIKDGVVVSWSNSLLPRREYDTLVQIVEYQAAHRTAGSPEEPDSGEEMEDDGMDGEEMEDDAESEGGSQPDTADPVSPVQALGATAQVLGLAFDQGATSSRRVRQERTARPHTVISGVDFARGEITSSIKYIVSAGKTIEKAHEISLPLTDHWYQAYVSTTTGKVIAMVDFVFDATYRVVKAPNTDPTQDGLTLVKSPEHTVASPLGWHRMVAGGPLQHSTSGNNAVAVENVRNLDPSEAIAKGVQATVGAAMHFNPKFDAKKDPAQNQRAAITNLFYWCNTMHDLSYAYGFDEQAGNFQDNNFGKGGKGGDRVICLAQDGSGTDNANFMSPPDGHNGVMRMYVFTQTKPQRDGDLENDIIQHEYGHGISTRLTGGPANPRCLSSTRAGGMGEGWSDYQAYVWMVRKEWDRNHDIIIGDYVMGNTAGIRSAPYSTSLERNKLKYSSLSHLWEVHDIGELWATLLYEVMWNLIDKNGFEPDLFKVTSSAGNVKLLQLVYDAFKLQPCNPSFIQARDAIVLADKLRYNGDNACAIWAGFAKRGLGYNATDGAMWTKDDFTLPPHCSTA